MGQLTWHGTAWHGSAQHGLAPAVVPAGDNTHRNDPLHGLQLQRILVAIKHLLEVIVPAPQCGGKSQFPFSAIFNHF